MSLPTILSLISNQALFWAANTVRLIKLKSVGVIRIKHILAPDLCRIWTDSNKICYRNKATYLEMSRKQADLECAQKTSLLL